MDITGAKGRSIPTYTDRGTGSSPAAQESDFASEQFSCSTYQTIGEKLTVVVFRRGYQNQLDCSLVSGLWQHILHIRKENGLASPDLLHT